MADFSLLPDEAWVQIMSYLPIVERYMLSLCCRRLYDVFCHPSLWHTETLSFLGSSHNYTRRGEADSSSAFYQKTLLYGKYFQNLKIIVKGHLIEFPSKWEDVLNDVAYHCRLDTLTLEIGQMTSLFHLDGVPPKPNALVVILAFVKKSFRLRKLSIRSWPMYDLDNCEILKVLIENPKLKNLEELSLFIPEIRDNSWSERAPILPTKEQTLTTVQHFQHLTHLSVRSTMMSTQLLDELAKHGRAKLQVLGIVIHYIDHEVHNFEVPFISSLAWRGLTTACPDLKVDCVILLRVSHMEIAKMLTPEVPLRMLTYMKYARVDPQTVSAIGEHFFSTFETLQVFCDTEQLDEALMSTVSKCAGIRDLVFHGNISAETVAQIAEAKGRVWKRFSVLEQNVSLRDEFEDLPEDQVLAPGEDGQYVLVAMRRFHVDEDDREAQVRLMSERVSAALGYNWVPS